MKLEFAFDIQKRINFLVKKLNLKYISAKNLICFKSIGSSGRSYARIWSLPKIWQMGLNIKAHYCIEVISEKFYKQSLDEQEKILIHELLHIPKNFSGALVPHRTHKHRSFRHYHDRVEELYKQLKSAKINSWSTQTR
jgi:predicted metallopeptidase